MTEAWDLFSILIGVCLLLVGLFGVVGLLLLLHGGGEQG